LSEKAKCLNHKAFLRGTVVANSPGTVPPRLLPPSAPQPPSRPCSAAATAALARWCLAAALALAGANALAFDFDALSLQAQALAQQAPRPAAQAPASLQALSYDQARDLRFRPDRALWRDLGLPFEAMFFHLGHVQRQVVRVNEITPQGEVVPVRYDAAAFDTGRTVLDPALPADLGYAGFRLHTALNQPQYKDELVVFQGASYFRVLGAGQHYGLSARGLAIDTVGGRGEEFPRFTEFWLQRPGATAQRVVVLALLESERATGAYRFEFAPGTQTAVDVRARLFLRDGVHTLGVAPLTSMFFFGEGQPRPGDFRPEVHDSDGLLVAAASGEWLWRPLQNPARPLVSSFAMAAPRGFGLMQRDRRFAAYEDTEARYDRRPSAWVEPLGDWGPGRVELVQLPTPDETQDNVVAYWVPDRLPAPGQPWDVSYRLHWQGDTPAAPPGAWVAHTRIGRSHAELAAGEQQFIVDFVGPAVDALAADTPVRAVASSDGNGEITEVTTYRNEPGKSWRMALRVRTRDATRPLELRAFLQSGSHTLSETWSYLLPPQ
jgi:periplasmic glucans biosynthesis protein